MYILGNLYIHNNVHVVNVISSTPLEYPLFKKTHIVNDITIYKYIIPIHDYPVLKLGDDTVSISTEIPSLSNTSMYFVSCDGQNSSRFNYTSPIKYYNVTDDTDMWKKLYQDIQNDTNPHKYVFHIGDQVYMDDAHVILQNMNSTNDDDTILQTYYNVYVETFTKTYKQKVLSCAYNVMTCDDHEFFDNYKSEENNLTPKMIQYVTFLYKTIQEELYGDKEHNIKLIQWTDFQVIIPDLRKYRQFYTSEQLYPIMGKEQFDELSFIIQNTPSTIKNTYYISTVPLIGINISATYIKLDFAVDGYSNAIQERNTTLHKLFELKSNVTIVSGDYHLAEYYTLTKKDKTISQIITSPISSNPTGINMPSILLDILTSINSIVYDDTIDDITVSKKWSVLDDYNYLSIKNIDMSLVCYTSTNNKLVRMSDVHKSGRKCFRKRSIKKSAKCYKKHSFKK